MSVITPYIDNLENIKTEIPDIAKEAIKARSGEIIDLVRFGQLAIGRNSFDMPLKWSGGTGFYANNTQAYADKQGAATPKRRGSPYSFQWTGDTFDSMGLKQKDLDSYEIFSIDGKRRLLESLYGEIFRLTPEHNKFVNDTIIVPAIYQHILKNLLRVKR